MTTRRRPARGFALIVPLLAFFVASMRLVTPAIASPSEDAKRYYQEATTAYNLGDFERPIDIYKKAYQAKSDPVFLYNLAQAYRLAKNPTQALFFYRSYLRNRPDAPNRAEVEGRIADQEALLKKPDNSGTTPPPPNNTITP